MRIAVPTTAGKVSAHFGHCEKFALFDIRDGQIESECYLLPPDHEPGAFPRWLKEQGAELIISGGMGRRALDLFSHENIQVITGASASEPEELVKAYLEGNLRSGENICSH